jgi:hypothetical protein
MKAVLGLFIGFFLTTGCSPGEGKTPLAEPIPIVSPTTLSTTTPTVIWFPPTQTDSPVVLSTLPPTPNQRPGIGEVLFKDDFTNLNNWLGQMHQANGSVTMEDTSVTISIAQPRTQLSSIHSQLVLSDFYLEITTKANLCSNQDEYGLILRMNSSADLLRFTLSCDGQVRIALVCQGKTSFPQPWTFSGAVPRGAPGQSRLGVWSLGKEMRFFINDEFQIAIQVSNSSNGQIGVFARAAGENPVSISFSDLVVYKVLP